MPPAKGSKSAYAKVAANDDNQDDTAKPGFVEKCFNLNMRLHALIVEIFNNFFDFLAGISYVFYSILCGERAMGTVEEQRKKLAERRRQHLKQAPEPQTIAKPRPAVATANFLAEGYDQPSSPEDVTVVDVRESGDFLLSALGAQPVLSSSGDPTAVCVGVLTWNLAESLPSDIDVQDSVGALLGSDNNVDGDAAPWIVAVAVQECGKIAVNPFSGASAKAATQTFGAFGRALEGRGLVSLAFESLGATGLGIFVAKSLFFKVSAVEPSTVACGPGGVLVNKGAAAIAFHLLGARFCFISSHLAAHEHKVLARHADYHYITNHLFTGGYDDSWEESGSADTAGSEAMTMERQKLSEADDSEDDGNDGGEVDYAVADETKAAPWKEYPGDGGRLVGQFEALFWAGDLNYRIDASRDRAEARVEAAAFAQQQKPSKEEAAARRWLRRRDQLTKGRREGYVFKGYAEGPLSFAPTFVRMTCSCAACVNFMC